MEIGYIHHFNANFAGCKYCSSAKWTCPPQASMEPEKYSKGNQTYDTIWHLHSIDANTLSSSVGAHTTALHFEDNGGKS
eukprot:5418969-Ditylum_brightwellii.AAC.2